MKIIDLLNKVANGEEVPEIIKYNDFIYKYDKDICDYEMDGCLYLFDNTDKLNDEIEIPGENEIPKKLNKLLYREDYATQDACIDDIIRQFNNLIDYLKSKGE